MGLKTAFTASILALATVAAAPQAGMAMPGAPLAIDTPAPLVTQVKDGIRWKKKHPYYKGHRGYRHKRPGYRYHNGYWFPALAFGIIIGSQATGRTYHLSESHYRWCEHKYVSYRRWDNTFKPYYKPRKACVSPYLR